MTSLDIVGTGFTVLDRVYADGRGLMLEELGGSCGNVLASLAMLDRHVAPILSLGSDDVGMRLVDEFSLAGAVTSYISRRADRTSPILVELLDTDSGSHRFSFVCPQTNEDLPRYESIDRAEVEHARPALSNCSVFYADRVSDAIVEAMEAASDAGAVVYFEPSEIGCRILFGRALMVSNVVKFSSERLGTLLDEIDLGPSTILIATHGEAGLELRQGEERLWCGSVPAPVVRDTCGSGDMVSVGLIDWLVTLRGSERPQLDIGTLVPGVAAGQRLASENCAFAGARGLFRHRGAAFARAVLDSGRKR